MANETTEAGMEGAMMIADLRKEIAGAFNQLRHGEELRTITVAKPACAAARIIVTGTFERYGVKLYGYNERLIMTTPKAWLRQMRVKAELPNDMALEKPLPLAMMAEVTVSAKAAAWAEYLLLRTGKLYVPGKYQDKRNEQWAKRHDGVMPPAWQDGKPWIETNCSEGMNAWQPLRDAMQEQRDGQAPTNSRRTSARKRRQ